MATFSDAFTRANSATLGASWTEGQGVSTGTAATISSNTLLAASGTTGAARWNTTLDTDDHYVELVLTSTPGSTKIVYLAVRAENDGRPNVYAAITTSGSWTINTMDNAGATTQRASGSYTASAGATYRLGAQGTVYTLYQNGTSMGSWNDSGVVYAPGSTRRWVCIGIFSSSGNIVADDFAAADTLVTGTVASALQKATFSGSGSQIQTGTMSSTLQKATAALSGYQTDKVELLTDNFSSQDNAKWQFYSGTSIVSNQLNIAADNTYPPLVAIAHYDLTNSSAIVEIPQVANGGAGNAYTWMNLQYPGFDGSNVLGMHTAFGVLRAQKVEGGSETLEQSQAYNATTMRWWRIRSVGTTIYWDYAADPYAGWTNYRTDTTTLNLTNFEVMLRSGVDVGSYTAIFDNFNVMPPPTGVLGSALQKATASLTGAQLYTGTIASALQPAVMAASGSQIMSGSMSSTLQHLLFDGLSDPSPSGQIESTLAKLVFAGAGEHLYTGSVASQLQPMTMSASGVMQPEGVLSAAIKAVVMAAAGSQLQTGSIASQLQPLIFAAAAEQLLTGSMASSLQPLDALLLGAMNPEGSIASTLQRLTMSGAGLHSQVGQLAAVLAVLEFEAEGRAKFFAGTPASRRNLIQAISRLNRVIAELRSNPISAAPRLNTIQAPLRTNDIESEPRRNSGA